MNEYTIETTKKFLSKYGKSPLADFGGGRPSTKKWMSNNLPLFGITSYENYDLIGGTKTLDLVKDTVQEKFNTILCIDTLEHVTNPFAVAKNIEDSLNPGGHALIIAPFKWDRHGKDYFRYTEEGLKVLFNNVEVVHQESKVEPLGESVTIIIKK